MKNAVDGMSGSSCHDVIRSWPTLMTVSTSTGWKTSSTPAAAAVHRPKSTVPSQNTATTRRIPQRNGHA